MLSTKSEAFIDDLRLYLVTSGKNEEEIKQLTEELRDHLMGAEKSGKNMDDIIDCTPEQYMVSLKKEMKTDYKSIIKTIPLIFAGLLAYSMMSSAIKGELELNLVQVIGFPFVAVIGLVTYVFFLQRAGKKQYSNKKFFFIGMIASGGVTALFILLWGSSLIVDPLFKANETVNWIVVALCSLIFIGSALWAKAWFPIWIPTILFLPDFTFRFSTMKEETLLILNLIAFILVFVFMIVSLVVTENSRKA